jgi:hypothetical protein
MTLLPEENENFSLFYWLQSLFSTTPISVVTHFPEENLVTPIISCDWQEINTYPFEMGNRETLKERLWYIDIFAKTNEQRDKIVFTLLHAVENGIPVYDYNEGLPPDVTTQTQLGTLIPLTCRAQKTDVPEYLLETPETLFYRATVFFTATVNSK